MFFGPLIWIVIIVGVVIGVMYLVRSQGAGGKPMIGSSKTPREILDERFARGEIDEKEYNERRRTLDS